MSDRSKLELINPKLFALLEKLDTDLHDQVKSVARIAEDYVERIPTLFPTYTMHNIEHSIRILEYIHDMIDPNHLPAGKMERYDDHLSPLEIATMIYGALLHDIGMAPVDETIVKQVKTDSLDGCDYKFGKFVEKFEGNETLALQDYLRRIHAQLSSRYVKTLFRENLHVTGYPSMSYADEIACLCESHNRDLEWAKSNLADDAYKGDYPCNYQYCALLLRLGDILDFDPRRTPYHLYKSINLTTYSKSEWEQHLAIHATKGRLQGTSNHEGWKSPAFYGTCENPSIYRKVLEYFSWIEEEVRNCAHFSTQFSHEKYRVRLMGPVMNKVEPKGFDVANQQLQVNYEAITTLLMGENIYGDKILGIRELVQNSLDACMLRQEVEQRKQENDEYEESEYQPKIRIILDYGKNQLVIKDDGIGMDRYILENYFLNAGKSFYKSDDFLLKGYECKAIGNFGIGFLSCFMLADKVKVKTRRYDEQTLFEVDLEKGSKFITLKRNESPPSDFRGTEILLAYDFAQNELELSVEKITTFIGQHFISEADVIWVEDRSGDQKVKVTTNLDTKQKSLVEKWKEQGRSTVHSTMRLDEYFNQVSGYMAMDFGSNQTWFDHKHFGNSSDSFSLADVDYFQNSFVRGDEHKGAYYYDGQSIVPLDDTASHLAHCIQGGQLNYLQLFYVSSEEDEVYDQAYDLLDMGEDGLSVYEVILDRLPYVLLFLDNKIVSDFAPYTFVSEYDDEWKHYKSILDFLKELDNQRSHFYFVHKREQVLRVEDEHEQVNIPLYDLSRVAGKFHKLFIKNVFITDLDPYPEIYLHRSCKIRTVLLNSFNDRIQPNISRSAISQQNKRELGYAIAKFCHLVALKYFANDPMKVKQIQQVLDHLYKEKSDLLHYENIDTIRFQPQSVS